MSAPATRSAIGWRLASRFVVRGTGFTFDLLDGLRFLDSVAVTERVDGVLTARQRQQEAFDREIFPRLCDELAGADRAAFKFWYRVRRDVHRGAVVGLPRRTLVREEYGRPDLAEWLTAWDDSCAELAELTGHAARVFAGELEQRRAALAGLMTRPPVREALWLSNPEMYDIGLAWYERHAQPGHRPAKVKHLERRFYSYLQRFCAKNDTTSFFGPLDYGRFTADRVVVELVEEPIRDRRVFVAYWAAEAIAERLAAAPELRPWLAPRRHPARPAPPARAGQLERAVHRCCDGRRTPIEIAAWLDRPLPDVLAAIDRLVDRGYLRTAPALPDSSLDPLADLRAALAGLPPTATRDHWLAELDAFAGIALRFRTAPLDQRRSLLAAGERRLAELTAASAPRGSGLMFQDRTLLYEECLGPIRLLRLPERDHETITRAIAPAAAVCAAYSAHVAAAQRHAAATVLHDVGADRSPVPLLRFLLGWRRHHPTPPPTPAADALQRRLSELAAARSDGPVCRLPAAEVVELAGPLTDAIVVSPDLLLAAPDLAALERGDYRVVLGELHHGVQPVGWMLTFAEDRSDWQAELAGHLPPPGPWQPANLLFRRRAKTAPPEFAGPSVQVTGTSGGPWPVDLTELTVALVDGQPVVRVGLADPPVRFLAPSFGVPEQYAPFASLSYPIGVLPQISLGRHTPRVEIGRLVYQRERWVVPAEELPGRRHSGSSVELLQAATRFRRRLGMPERVFVRAPGEPKPVLIDFCSYFAVELLAHLGRGGGPVRFEEMLPGPEQLWLRGPDGRRCVEFRTVLSLQVPDR